MTIDNTNILLQKIIERGHSLTSQKLEFELREFAEEFYKKCGNTPENYNVNSISRQSIKNWCHGGRIIQRSLWIVEDILPAFFNLTDEEAQNLMITLGATNILNTTEKLETSLISPPETKSQFIQKLLSQLNSSLSKPIMLLLQDTSPSISTLIEGYIRFEAQSHYAKDTMFFIRLPDYADESAFYKTLGGMFGFRKTTDDSSAFREELIKMIKKNKDEKKRFFCYMSRFGHLSSEIAQRLAAVLRSIYAECSNFHLILLGGRKLAELRHQDVHSFINDTIKLDWPELETEDIQEYYQCYYNDVLPIEMAQRFLAVTGGYLQLLTSCFDFYHQLNNTDKSQLDVIVLSNHLIKEEQEAIGEHFLPLLKTIECRNQLNTYLQTLKVHNSLFFPQSPFLRALFWKNLIYRGMDGFYWRCEIIRQVGLSVVSEQI